MILSSLIVFLNILVFYGYSLLFKFIFFPANFKTKYYDFIYGILILIFISSSINFFIAIKEISIFIYIVGLILFLFGFFKKFFQIKILSLLILSFIFVFISFGNSPLGDTNFYHLQSLKWIIDYKISFGLINLEERLAYSTLFPNLSHSSYFFRISSNVSTLLSGLSFNILLYSSGYLI